MRLAHLADRSGWSTAKPTSLRCLRSGVARWPRPRLTWSPRAVRRSSLPVHLDRVLTQASNLLASREPAPGLHAALHGLVEIVDALRGEGRQARGAARAAVVARLVDADAELMALVRSVAGPYLEELGGSADLELAPFRARMTEAAYVKARAACVDRFLRERYRLPTVRFD